MAREDITTSLNIDVSNFKKSISEANKQIKLANAEFKAAAAGMDDWQSSTDGISQKLNQLTSVLGNEKTKLKAYEAQLSEAEKASKSWSEKCDSLKKALQDLSDNGVSKSSDEYTALRRELDATEKAQAKAESAVDTAKISLINQQGTVNALEKDIRTYNSTLNDLESRSDSAENDVDDLSDALDDAGNSAEQLSGGFTILKGALSNLVADGFRAAISAARDFAGSMVDVAAEIKAENSQYAQTFGDMADQADAAIGRVAVSSGILDTRLRSTATGIYAFAMSSGADSAEAMDLMETALIATADSAAYYDRSLEDTAETLQSFLKGNYANDAALGVSATETTRNAAAMELFGQNFNDLSEIQKQQTLLKMVTDAQSLSGAMGQASREADGWENVQGNLNETWRQFKGEVGEPFLEALIPVIDDVTASFKEWKDGVDWGAFGETISSIAEAIKSGFGWIIENKDILISVISGIAAGLLAFNVASIIAAVVVQIQVMGGVMAALNAIMAANPIGLVATAIGLLVAAIVLLIQNWDTVKAAGVACWEAIKEAWNNVSSWFKTNITDPVTNFFSGMWDGLKNGASGAWDGIKNAFSSVTDWFKTTFSNAWNGVKDVFSTGGKIFDGIKEGIAATFKTVVNGIIGGINRVIAVPFNAINSALQTIRDISIAGIQPFSGLISTISVPQIPLLARGGVLRKGEIGLLEGNGAEAVVPLENNKRWISAVAREMSNQMNGVATIGGGLVNNSHVNNFTQVINAPKMPSRLELYRQTKNLLVYKGGMV